VVEERVRRIHGRTTEQQRRRNRKPLHRHFSSYTKSCRDEREELRVLPVRRIRIAWQGGVLVSQDGKHYCHFGQPKLCGSRKLRRTYWAWGTPETVTVV
jgi:hypothetical protein